MSHEVPAGLITPASVADPRVRRYVLPTRIVWRSADAGAIVENPDALLAPTPGQVTLGGRAGCALRSSGARPGILLDFGRELHGGVQILVAGTQANQPVRLRVRFGESAAEAMADLGGPTNATNDHAIRDQVCLVPWLGSHEVGNTGFRFVRLDLEDPHSHVLLAGVRAVLLYRDLPYMGSFRCSDERLERIWEAGAWTVHLNMQEFLWDGIKRDRLVWIGDMHPETMTIGAVFGANEIVPASLDLIRNETPLPGWMNGISSYSLWWILIHDSWHRHHGDLGYLREQQPYLSGLLGQLLGLVGADGRERLTGGRFLDWPSSGNEAAVHAGLQALMVLALEAGGRMCDVLGDTDARVACADGVRRLRGHVPPHGGSKQAAALMALSGLGDPAALNREVMAVDGARGMSTFYGYHVLQARALAGDVQGCLDCIRDYWGAMLDLGATTFWEDFDLDWVPNAGRIDELVPPGRRDIHGEFGAHCYRGYRHSLCHGWASGPTAWLSEHVLGVRILEPGCAAIQVEPRPGDLTWAEGTFPTPHGVVRVRHEARPDGSVRSEVEAPAGVRVVRL